MCPRDAPRRYAHPKIVIEYCDRSNSQSTQASPLEACTSTSGWETGATSWCPFATFAAQVRAMASWPSIEIGGRKVEGISIAGQETCIILPQLSLALDTGRCPQRSAFQRTVLLSHAHMDHIGGLPFHVATRALQGLPPTTVVLPSCVAKATEGLLEAHRALDGSEMRCDILPCKPGDELVLMNKLICRPFQTFHPVPSQGYTLFSRKQKLKAEYIGRPSEEIRDLRLSGQVVTEQLETCELAFTGDTGPEFITAEGSADALRARLLIMELTFLDDKVAPESAHEMGHMHIDDLVDHADKFKNEHILLIHFSARYSAAQIFENLDDRLPADLRKRCIPFMNGFLDYSKA
ncbi:hypothetical protein WJX74_005763 [Apatococcus lobatus]|uniref:Metallo-beta-lactamase domain-containing protein n=1 Tax=Apatococcus lobatus TaxID=904363 RepID=A0AAW1RNN1_9CHLO